MTDVNITKVSNTVTVTEADNAVTVTAPGPKGDPGATGATGPTGPTGATGPAAPTPISSLPASTVHGWQHWFTGGNAYLDTTAVAQPPWSPTVDATLTEIQVNVVTGIGSATVDVALYECDQYGVPGDKVTDLATIDCSATGNASVTGLSVSVTTDTVYCLATAGGATAPRLRAQATGTSGVSVAWLNQTFIPNSQVADNLPRSSVARRKRLGRFANVDVGNRFS